MSTTRAALARRYRPRRFAELTAQAHVSATLRAAVARGRTAHAYLFAGPRGVGKTTAARVLAMALNCPDRGQDGEPCGGCESCERIWAGRTSLDVIEIDAASNRGVDDARDLRERAMYAPTDERRYKVYIIDEAHMLTREAWNALLKILEEPPPRVIFVFATTEPQKIQQAAPPILSRCQRFDFRRIPVADIVGRLHAVLAEEGIVAGEDALVPIARRAEGGMRDALSLVDQVLSFGDTRITGEDVRRVLGLVGEELYVELFEILADRRYGDVFRFVQRVLDEGYDLAEFYRGLADALRALLVARFDGPDAPDVRDDLKAAYAAVAGRFAPADLLRMLATVAELDTEGRLRKSATPRTMLEAMLLRFAYLDRTVDLETLIAAVAAGTAPPDDDTPPGRPPSGGQRVGPAGGRSGGTRAEPGPPSSTPRRGPARPAAQPAAEAGEAASAAAGALRALAEHRRGVPQGLGIFLRSATVLAEDGERIVVAFPPGPALERLAHDEAALRGLEAALADELGRAARLEVRSEADDRSAQPAERITPGKLKNDRLARLLRGQPALERAVEAWDLELLD